MANGASVVEVNVDILCGAAVERAVMHDGKVAVGGEVAHIVSGNVVGAYFQDYIVACSDAACVARSIDVGAAPSHSIEVAVGGIVVVRQFHRCVFAANKGTAVAGSCESVTVVQAVGDSAARIAHHAAKVVAAVQCCELGCAVATLNGACAVAGDAAVIARVVAAAGNSNGVVDAAVSNEPIGEGAYDAAHIVHAGDAAVGKVQVFECGAVANAKQTHMVAGAADGDIADGESGAIVGGIEVCAFFLVGNGREVAHIVDVGNLPESESLYIVAGIDQRGESPEVDGVGNEVGAIIARDEVVKVGSPQGIFGTDCAAKTIGAGGDDSAGGSLSVVVPTQRVVGVLSECESVPGDGGRRIDAAQFSRQNGLGGESRNLGFVERNG